MPQQNDEAADRATSWEQHAVAGRFEVIPAPFRWYQSAHFAHLLNGYALLGSDTLSKLANERLQEAQRSGTWWGDAQELWLCLFYEHRRWRHFGIDPEGEDKALLDTLCETLRVRLVDLDANGRQALAALVASHAFPGTRENTDGE